jgi:hypothetical protein
MRRQLARQASGAPLQNTAVLAATRAWRSEAQRRGEG